MPRVVVCAWFVSACLTLTVACGAPQAAPPPQAAAQAPDVLRCEYLTAPLGIDARKPRLSWVVRDARRGALQTAYRVLVADSPRALDHDDGNLWDSGRVASDQSIQIEYAGKPLLARQRAWWKVRTWTSAAAGDNRADAVSESGWSAAATWTMGLLEPADWGEARWIGDATPAPAGGFDPLPAPLLRRAFDERSIGKGGRDAPAKIERATLYVSALGLYQACLNDRSIGERELAPEWTDYNQRVQYQTYDVTPLMQAGPNVLAVTLADGWYAGKIGLTGIVPNGPPRAVYARQPRLLARLEIERADGSRDTIVTDEQWKTSLRGPVRVGDLLDGETYDARLEQPGWCAPGFDDSGWSAAAVAAPQPAPRLVAQPNQPIRVTRDLTPVALTEPAPGLYVYDLGQNMVGRCRLKLQAPAGTTITLRHAEVLNPDGTLYVTNLRGAAQTDRYIALGRDSGEVFEPRFTYHGFRFVEVSGLPGKPALDALVGRVFNSDSPEVGRFESSDPRLNRLMQNILWTQRANLMSTPTDCPQRDERLGWTGDILAFAQTACFNMDMSAFLSKWIPDLRDAQARDGRYPDFAPHPFDPNARFSGVPAWGDAGVFVPWRQWVNYADRRMLAEHLDSMIRWIEYIHAQNPDLLWKKARGNDYGDWLNADTLKLEGWPAKGAEMPKEVFATAFFCKSTELVGRMAALAGRADVAKKHAELATQIKAAFNRAYVSPDGRITGDTQAGYAIALHFDLLPDALRGAAAGHMVAAFKTYNGQISTGFHSTICLMNELTRCGRTDEAYRLLNNRSMPSWGYAIDHGATTIWERWDGYVEGRGFQDPGMNSFSHYAIGSVGEWIWRTVVGINPDEAEPAYKQFTLRPEPGGGLDWVRGEYDSIHGTIRSAWKRDGADWIYEFTVPANTTATVILRARAPAAVREGAVPAADAPAVQFVAARSDTVELRIGSGSYRFTVSP